MPYNSPTTCWEISLSVRVTIRLFVHRTLQGTFDTTESDTKITTH